MIFLSLSSRFGLNILNQKCCLPSWTSLWALEEAASFCQRRQADIELKFSPLVFVFPGLEEEGLLLEDTVQTPAVENHPAEELPAEPPVPELPEVVTLPEPPVEVEASGSGTVDLEDLLRPSTPTAAVEEDKEESAPEDEPTTGEVTSEEEIEEVEVAAVTEEPAAAAVDEGYVDEAEVPELLEEEEQTEEVVEEDLPAPEVIDTAAAEAPEPEEAEAALLPVDEEPVDDTEDEEISTEDLTEDLTEDEILLIDADEAVTHVVSPVQPTALSPERESPFTQIADISPASEGHPDIFIPTLVEVHMSEISPEHMTERR